MTTTPRSYESVKQPIGILRNPNYVEAVVLVANTSQQVTVPPAAVYAIFTGNVDFYVAYGANPTAVVPGSSTTDGSSNELNPIARFFGGNSTVQSVAKLALISPSAGIVTISFWAA